MAEWTYTLWRREYHHPQKSLFVLNATRHKTCIAGERETIEELARLFYNYKTANNITFDELDFITTIPVRAGAKYIDRPAFEKDILDLEAHLNRLFMNPARINPED